MNNEFFASLDEKKKMDFIEIFLENKGKCIETNSGLCGDIYIFDKGENNTPRYTCVKIPKSTNISAKESAKRFVNELELQLSFYSHEFVHWAFNFGEVMETPFAMFRYWGNDLNKFIMNNDASDIQKISILIYTCVGLRHCYNKGLIAHQDLKPANIFLRDMTLEQVGLPDLDVYTFALIADFGLANAAKVSNVYDGTRPYMAPEQWNKESLSVATDVFALGVILFELMTGGYHPVGIMLREFWPTPSTRNSKKWTREQAWKKWIENGCLIDNSTSKLTDGMYDLIKSMLSYESDDRPAIDEVINKLLVQVKTMSTDSYDEINRIIEASDNKINSNSLKTKWPYLDAQWNLFKKKFG